VSKFQKIAFIVFVFLSAIFTYFAYQTLKSNKRPPIKVLTLIPDGCETLLAFDNYAEFSNSLRNKNLLWQDLKNLKALRQFEAQLDYFDSLLVANDDLSQLLNNNQLFLALYPKNKFLIACNLKELSEEQTYQSELEALKEAFHSRSMKVRVSAGVIALSNSQNLVEEVFSDQVKSLTQNHHFQHLQDAANYSGSSMYINKGSNSFLFGNSYASITLKPDKVILNGLKLVDSTEFFGELHSEPLSNLDFLQHIPLVCNAFEVFTVKNAINTFSRTLKNDWWTEVNNEAMFNAKKEFYNAFSDRMIKISMPSKSTALLITVQDSVKLADALQYMKDSTLYNNKICRIAKQSGSFTSSTFPFLKLKEFKYFASFRDYLVLTTNEGDAEIFVNSSANSSSILDNKQFLQFASRNFNSEFHYLNYKLVSALGREEIPFSSLINYADLGKLKNISHCSYSAVYKNKFLNYRFNLSYSQENFTEEPGALWTNNSDTAIISKPFLFKNHINKGNEIVFQTADKNLHLVNATGKTIWKKTISEQIRSEIFTVDAFKNGKYQMLFNTDHFLHLIDRNGNYVQGYPVKLPARATNKLTVFDYEGKNDLRLMIACANEVIYNYSIWGVHHEGYTPYSTDAEVNLPIKYCRIGLSDYLVTADRRGKLYAFSRKGSGRIDFRNKVPEQLADFDVECGNLLANSEIIYYDKTSKEIGKISLSDKKNVLAASETKSASAHCFADIDGNKIVDVVLTYPDKIEAFDLNGTKNFSREITDTMQVSEIGFSIINNNSYLLINELSKAKSLIYDIEQKVMKEFRSGQTPVICNLFNDGKIYLLLVSDGELKCVKL
jgi:hypothetical protein